MIRKLLSFFLLIIPLTFFCQTTGLPAELAARVENERYFRVMFYNCENLFDIYDDTLTNDEEFLPTGNRFWTYDKLSQKLRNIMQVITAVGGWQPPELIGVCEVENLNVLNMLRYKTQLSRFDYGLLHKESPDMRGIDVALFYNKTVFKPIKTDFIKVNYPNSKKRFTRDILYTCGIINGSDTLHVFVNHWPSRYGGQLESEDNRFYTASLVRQKVDSIFATNSKANIYITGDLNDEPNDKSIITYLKAGPPAGNVINTELYNLSYNLQFVKGAGTHKFQGKWAVLDHIIVSGALLNGAAGLLINPDGASVFNAPFLLEPDESFVGLKPFRTYAGFKFNGGYSDHLPTFIDINKVIE